MAIGGPPFATKPALAAAMLTRAVEAEVSPGSVAAGCVTADEVYGADPMLRAHIEVLGLSYVLAIGCDGRVPTHGGLMRPDRIAVRGERSVSTRDSLARSRS